MKMVVRCKRCGGRPLETNYEGVREECRCSSSAWVQVDRYLLFVRDEVEVGPFLRCWKGTGI